MALALCISEMGAVQKEQIHALDTACCIQVLAPEPQSFNATELISVDMRTRTGDHRTHLDDMQSLHQQSNTTCYYDWQRYR